ncbi:Flagellar basal-body P-ring formation protein flgA [hydrothermal vent metagenome]|uniref:Flagellar basal-body P-ring formation protein flgA n=1 Tax=hydrothermal vent metagenome TaxID=652676 RepID=A0A3B0WSU7_9ZZZZ
MDVYATEINHSNQKQEHNEIYHLVTEHLKQKTDQQIFDATFELKKLSTHLKLPKCQNHLILKDRNPDSVSGRITLSVSCEHPKWRIFVPVTIKGKLPVIISTKGIPKQAVIKDRDVKKVLLPYQKVPKGYLMEVNNVIGMRTTKAIPPKKVLRIKDLQPPYWVFKNQQVNIITRIGGIEVKTIGKALKNGLEQEQVPVKNNSSQKVIKGIVIAPNTILIP